MLLKGIKPNSNQLANMGMSRSTAYKLINDEAESITLRQMEILCKHLNCTPNELFCYKEEKGKKLPPEHELNKIAYTENEYNPIALLRSVPTDKLKEINAFIENYLSGKDKEQNNSDTE